MRGPGPRSANHARLPARQRSDTPADSRCAITTPDSSLTTRGYHWLVKRPYYTRVGVGLLWEVDPEARTLVVSELKDGRWLELGALGEEGIAPRRPEARHRLHEPRWGRSVLLAVTWYLGRSQVGGQGVPIMGRAGWRAPAPERSDAVPVGTPGTALRAAGRFHATAATFLSAAAGSGRLSKPG